MSSAALGSLGYGGQPAVYLYIAPLEVNVLNCRGQGAHLGGAIRSAGISTFPRKRPVMPQTALGLTELPDRQHRVKWPVGQPMINGNGR